MNSFSMATLVVVVGALGGIAGTATAAPITYDFTGTVTGNQALTGTHVYTASGGPSITAVSGSYTQSGTGAPSAGDPFTAGGQLVGNNRGSDEQGVGVCFGNGCNNGHINDNPEIDADSREAVRLDISALLSGYGALTINADSATDGEVLGIFASNATGTALGAKLADATSGGGSVSITPTSDYLFFVADNSTFSGADVLLHSLSVTRIDPVPEPASVALLGAALFGLRLARRRARPIAASAAPPSSSSAKAGHRSVPAFAAAIKHLRGRPTPKGRPPGDALLASGS